MVPMDRPVEALDMATSFVDRIAYKWYVSDSITTTTCLLISY